MTSIIRILCIALLSVAGFLSVVSQPARADERNERCERRIHQAEDKLRDAINRHGEDSRQARKRRAELDQARRDCPDYRGDRDHHDDDHHDPH